MSHNQRKSRRYQFEPLTDSKAEIRVLSLHPPDENGYLQCKLEKRRLDDKPFYVAVSYECGDPGLEVDIKMDGKIVPIRHNLWLFLDHLLQKRRTLIEKDVFRLWADFICIDQRNPIEKMDQISLMSRIFNQADSVFAWLGWTSKSDSELALRSFPTFVKQFTSMSEDSDFSILNECIRGAQWNAMIRILDLSYWSRRWVVQELLLARSITLFSDTVEFPWFMFQDFFSCIRSLLNLPISTGNISWRKNREAMATVVNTIPFEIWRWRCRPSPPTVLESGLAELIHRFAPTVCEKEHDKIYCLMSLIGDGRKLAADYQCSMFQLLYRIFTPSDLTKFDFRSFLTLVEELGLNYDDSQSSCHNPAFLDFSFQESNVDQLVKQLIPVEMPLQNLRGLLKLLLALPLFVPFHHSFLTSGFQTTPVGNHLPHSSSSIDRNAVKLTDYTFYATRKGYMACSLVKPQVGDLLCPLSPSIAFVMQRSALHLWSVMGLAFILFFHGEVHEFKPLEKHYRGRTQAWSDLEHEYSTSSSVYNSFFPELFGEIPDESHEMAMGDTGKSLPNIHATLANMPRQEVFSGATLTVCRFVRTKFIFCTLLDCTFTECSFSDCDFDNCEFSGQNEFIGNNTIMAGPAEQKRIGEGCRDELNQDETNDYREKWTLNLEMMEAKKLAQSVL